MTFNIFKGSTCAVVIALAACLVQSADPPDAAKSRKPDEATLLAEYLEKTYRSSPPPEAVKMMHAILSGSQMGPGEGWFGPAGTRYGFAWLAKASGVDPAKKEITRRQFRGQTEWFDRLDRNKDGKIQPDDLDWSDSNTYVQMAYTMNRTFRLLDPKGNAKISRAEWMAFFDKAAQGGEYLTSDQFTETMLAGYSGSFMPGDRPTKEVLLRGLFSGEVGSLQEGPKVDQMAPNFTLKKAQGQGSIELAKLLGSKPVVLVTGNFTCGPFRTFYPAVDELFKRYKDKAHFVMVYVREAHPTDGWKMESNTRVGVAVKQPTSFDERLGVAGQFCSRLNPNIPVVVDDVNDAVGNAYSGMPARLYVIDKQGKVAYKGGRGPFGFKPGEMEQALVMSLVEQLENNLSPTGTTARNAENATPTSAVAGSIKGGFPMLSDEETWAKMPRADKGQGIALPSWAKAVAVHLPKTAAAMLELDWAQRTKSPLDPALRAKMRWVVAHANKCQYAEATALADLKRATGSDAAGQTLAGPLGGWPEADREPLEFAKLLTRSASTIPDGLFAQLRERFGDKKTASMVLLAAYGNFQDRIILGLGLPLEEKGPMPPLEIAFAKGAFQSAPILPEQKELPTLLAGGETVVSKDPEWSQLTFSELQNRLEKQRSRTPRLPIPTWEEVKKGLPPEFTSRPTRIIWNLVCSGYVPELAVPWSMSTRTMWAEAGQDRVFEESLFWIQTRSIRCNYCMGHCEMLLEVAGLDKNAVAERTKRLASDDWSAFPPAEQRAYAYARKLSKTPWELTSTDYAVLEKDLGPEKAMAIFWWLCRGLYMTRISDGFQLPLEKDNVFGDYAPKKEVK